MKIKRKKESGRKVGLLFFLVFIAVFFVIPNLVVVKASGYSDISEGSLIHEYLGTYEVSRNDEGEYKKVVYADTGGSKVVKSNDGVELSNWDKEFVYTDQVGSTSFNLDNNGEITEEFKNGNDINKLRYFAYGSTINSIDTTNLVTEDTYTGQKDDTELDLMYYNARYYDPVRGRFIQADSVNDGLNRYMYVAGNPVTKLDPTGHKECEGIYNCGGKPDLSIPQKTSYEQTAEGIREFRMFADPYIDPNGGSSGLAEIVNGFIDNWLNLIDFEDGGDIAIANAWTQYMSTLMDGDMNFYKPDNPGVILFEKVSDDQFVPNALFTEMWNGNYGKYDITHFSTYVLRNVLGVDARQISWSTSGGGDYMVVFSDNELRSQVYYITNGDYNSMSLTDFIWTYDTDYWPLTGQDPVVLFQHPQQYYYHDPYGNKVKNQYGNWILDPNERLYNRPITNEDLQEWFDYYEGYLQSLETTKG